MTINVTPQRAQELLDIANRGETDGQRPVTVAAKYAPLAEAAPALAQTVASMHYEYAVQLEDTTGETRFAMSMYNVTRNPEEAWWTPTPNAPLANHWRFSQTGLKVRIVRRLATDPEVVE